MVFYNSCKSGSRTLGACDSVTSVVWFLGYARHWQNIKCLSTKFLSSISGSKEENMPEEVHIGIDVSGVLFTQFSNINFNQAVSDLFFFSTTPVQC